MFIEYPKALYKDGVGSIFEELPYVVVNSADEEKRQNAQGWFEIGKAQAAESEEDQSESAKRRGRPRKTEAE